MVVRNLSTVRCRWAGALSLNAFWSLAVQQPVARSEGERKVFGDHCESNCNNRGRRQVVEPVHFLTSTALRFSSHCSHRIFAFAGNLDNPDCKDFSKPGID